jgi:hypothetical protein
MATAQNMGPKKGFIRKTKARETPTSNARKVRVSSFAYIDYAVP